MLAPYHLLRPGRRSVLENVSPMLLLGGALHRYLSGLAVYSAAQGLHVLASRLSGLKNPSLKGDCHNLYDYSFHSVRFCSMDFRALLLGPYMFIIVPPLLIAVLSL